MTRFMSRVCLAADHDRTTDTPRHRAETFCTLNCAKVCRGVHFDALLRAFFRTIVRKVIFAEVMSMTASPSTHASVASPRGVEWNYIDVAESRRPETMVGRQIDGDPELMEASYRLRYQVYCVERSFLKAADYPEQLERDEFDRYSLHVGVVDRSGELMATTRLIRVSMWGLPLFRHCRIFPDETGLYQETNRIAEVSRLCVSRHLKQRGHGKASVASMLYRALYQVSKRARFTHWLVATEHSLQRRVTEFGFPFRAIGPSVDYFGPVVPYLMDLQEFDRVIVSGTRPALASFPDGLEPEYSPLAQAQFC
jgi:N-acyl-L-homoserine lactone synthetase